jgi:hypothetical protein
MPKPRPPADPGRPNPREVVDRARAAAGPRVAKAMETAGPKVEKAAAGAGKLLGTLRDRARDTVKEFTDAYGDVAEKPAGPDQPPPRRRPRPGPR